MSPSILVLTDFSPAAERARAYAALLAARVGATLHLVHIYLPVPIASESGLIIPVRDEGYVRELRHSLERVAAHLPGPATAELLETDWYKGVDEALAKYDPLLLVAGLTATHGPLDEWLSNRTLQLPTRTGHPLLLVPQSLPDAALRPPRRLALAVEDRAFELVHESFAITPLLDALDLDIITMTVLTPDKYAGGCDGLGAAQHSGLAAAAAHSSLHKVISGLPASGILQAVDELSIDVLALLDQGHGWLHKAFSGSVIAHVLRHAPVPVLLLSAPAAVLRD